MSLALELEPERAFLRKRSTSEIRELPGFVRGRHRLPEGSGLGAERFVRELGHAAIVDEVREVYEAAKLVLGLRRRQLERAVADGGGNVGAPQFEFAIELGLDPTHAKLARWQRSVVMLRPPMALPPEFDSVFPVACDELVVPFAGVGHTGSVSEEFDELVDRLEDFAERHGGGVEEDETRALACLRTPDGSRLALDLRARELSLRILGCTGCCSLLLEARRRFADLAEPIVLALERSRA